jgi:hypothetical protein
MPRRRIMADQSLHPSYAFSGPSFEDMTGLQECFSLNFGRPRAALSKGSVNNFPCLARFRLKNFRNVGRRFHKHFLAAAVAHHLHKPANLFDATRGFDETVALQMRYNRCGQVDSVAFKRRYQGLWDAVLRISFPPAFRMPVQAINLSAKFIWYRPSCAVAW